MALDSTLASWLTLSQIPGLGAESLRKLLQAFGSPNTVFTAPNADVRRIVKPAVAQQISLGIIDENLVFTEQWLSDPLNHIVTIADENYPQQLLNTQDPPFLLFVKGRLDLLNKPSLAIVGSRNATPQGIRNAEAFAQSLSELDFCIVSGMALGVDTAAHLGGLKGQGSSIAVVGTGLDRIYPASNKELAHQLAMQGAIISEFPLGTPPLPSNFPRRNRIISGLSQGCLIVEASLQSGSLITARLALEQGREVFAIPGSIHSPQTKGCHALIKQGAKLVENAQDIMQELAGIFPPVNASSPSTPEHELFQHLHFDPVDFDSLSALSGLTIAALSAILLQLELEGKVATLPGGLYQRIV
ncbi:MAG: DNA-processing protein DprA [Gallionellaceae bacterium]|nr:DNA-processing protein DprA [Gallionellaceae bacterium]